MRCVTTMDLNRKELIKLVSSFVIGDGALSNLKRYPVNGKHGEKREKNSKYYLKQLSTHRDYVEWQASILEGLTKVSITTTSEYIDNRGYKCKEQLVLKTHCHPFYTQMRQNFYINNFKIINPHYLKLWDAQTLAILYMDDGWLEKTQREDGKIYYRIGISTHSYTYGDNMLLKEMIKEKFAIEFDIQKHKQKSGEYLYYLRNTKDNSLRFIDLVAPYVLSSFQYKIEKSVQLAPGNQDEDIV